MLGGVALVEGHDVLRRRVVVRLLDERIQLIEEEMLVHAFVHVDDLELAAVDVERQYFIWLWTRERGDFAAMAKALLGDPEHARKVQLRFNQLGLKVRELKDRAGSA